MAHVLSVVTSPRSPASSANAASITCRHGSVLLAHLWCNQVWHVRCSARCSCGGNSGVYGACGAPCEGRQDDGSTLVKKNAVIAYGCSSSCCAPSVYRR